MPRIIVIYGVIAGAIVIASIAVDAALGIGNEQTSELLGYLIMLAGLSLIFMGIKRYRDTVLGGVIRFWTALGVGLGIALVSGVVYVIGWEAYMYLTDYTFFDVYSKGVIAAKQASGASADEIAKLSADMAAMGEQYAHPLYRMKVTLFEILPVGIVVALISAALLRWSRFLSVHGNRSASS